MSGKLLNRNQHELFRTRLEDLINPNHELVLCQSLHKGSTFFNDIQSFINKFLIFIMY